MNKNGKSETGSFCVPKTTGKRKSLTRPDDSWRLTPMSIDVIRHAVLEGQGVVEKQLEQLQKWLTSRQNLGHTDYVGVKLSEVSTALALAHSDEVMVASLAARGAFDVALVYTLRAQRGIARGAALALGVHFEAERARAVAGARGLASKTQRYRSEVEEAIREGRLHNYPSMAAFARDMLSKQKELKDRDPEKVTDPRTIERWTSSYLRLNPQYVVSRAERTIR